MGLGSYRCVSLIGGETVVAGEIHLLSLENRKCKYARFFANITGKMQIIKDYQLY